MADRNSKPEYDPTEGMSTMDKFWAGMGKAFVDVGRWAGNKVGAVSDQEMEDARQLDAPLMNTKAGKVGNLTGTTVMVAGTAYVGGGLVTMASGTAAGGAAAAETAAVVTNTSRLSRFLWGTGKVVAQGAGAGVILNAADNAANGLTGGETPTENMTAEQASGLDAQRVARGEVTVAEGVGLTAVSQVLFGRYAGMGRIATQFVSLLRTSGVATTVYGGTTIASEAGATAYVDDTLSGRETMLTHAVNGMRDKWIGARKEMMANGPWGMFGTIMTTGLVDAYVPSPDIIKAKEDRVVMAHDADFSNPNLRTLAIRRMLEDRVEAEIAIAKTDKNNKEEAMEIVSAYNDKWGTVANSVVLAEAPRRVADTVEVNLPSVDGAPSRASTPPNSKPQGPG